MHYSSCFESYFKAIAHDWKVREVKVLYSILVFLFVIDSGSWFGIQNTSLFDALFFVASCATWILTVRKASVKKKNMWVAALIGAFFFVNLVYYLGDSPVYTGYISYLLRLIGTMIMCESIGYEDFSKRFISIISGISIASLAVYIGFSYLKIIPGITEDGYYYMMYRVFRVYRNYSGTMYRNASIFWEPGAYQLFANLAIAMIMRKNGFIFSKKMSKTDWIRIAVLIISVVTTFSTTGYLMTCVVVGIPVVKSLGHIKKSTKIIIGLPILVALGYVIFIVAKSEVVTGKLMGNNTASYSVRSNDIIASIRMILTRPILGYGFGTEGMWAQLRMAGRTTYTNSSGFLMAMSTFGVPFGIVYLKRILAYSKQYWTKGRIIFLILVLFSGFTEGFCFYPIYFSMLFAFRERARKG